MDSSKHDVAIFWDFENCRPATQSSGHDVADSIRRLAHTFGTVKTFKAYLDISEYIPKKTSVLRSQLQSSGVSLTDCPHNGRKDVADMMMMVDMMSYAIDTHPVSTTLVVITADRDFTYALSVLRLRQFSIVLITNDSAAMCLKSRGSVCYDWKSDILKKGPSTDAYKAGGVDISGRSSSLSCPAITPPNPPRDDLILHTITPQPSLEPSRAASEPASTQLVTIAGSHPSSNEQDADYFSPASHSSTQHPSILSTPSTVDIDCKARRTSLSSPLCTARELQELQDTPPLCKAESATFPQDCEHAPSGTIDQSGASDGGLYSKERAVEPKDTPDSLSEGDEPVPISACQAVLATGILCDAPPVEDAEHTDSEAEAILDTARIPSLISADSLLDDCSSESAIGDIPALDPVRRPSISAGASSSLVGEGEIVTHPCAVPHNTSVDDDDKPNAHSAGENDVAATLNHPPSHLTPVLPSHDVSESVAGDISTLDPVPGKPSMSVGASSTLGEGQMVAPPSAASRNSSVNDDGKPNPHSASGSNVAATPNHLSSHPEAASTSIDFASVDLKPLPSGLLPLIETLERHASKGILDPYYYLIIGELMGTGRDVLDKAGATTLVQYVALAAFHKIVKISHSKDQPHLLRISLGGWKRLFVDPREKQQDHPLTGIPPRLTTPSALSTENHTLPSAPLASSPVSSSPTRKLKPLPAGLIYLVNILERYLKYENEVKPLCSRVAEAIIAGGRNVYAQANVTRFKEYRALAERAGVIQCGSKDGQCGTEWIMLLDWKKQYYDPRLVEEG